jgi:hypothetical protein
MTMQDQDGCDLFILLSLLVSNLVGKTAVASGRPPGSRLSSHLAVEMFVGNIIISAALIFEQGPNKHGPLTFVQGCT